jgi:hypothetical protein
LGHTAHDDIVDRLRIDSGAIDQGVQHLSAKVRWVPSGKLSVPAATRGAHRIDYIGFGHEISRSNEIGFTLL